MTTETKNFIKKVRGGMTLQEELFLDATDYIVEKIMSEIVAKNIINKVINITHYFEEAFENYSHTAKENVYEYISSCNFHIIFVNKILNDFAETNTNIKVQPFGIDIIISLGRIEKDMALTERCIRRVVFEEVKHCIDDVRSLFNDGKFTKNKIIKKDILSDKTKQYISSDKEIEVRIALFIQDYKKNGKEINDKIKDFESLLFYMYGDNNKKISQAYNSKNIESKLFFSELQKKIYRRLNKELLNNHINPKNVVLFKGGPIIREEILYLKSILI